MKGVSASLPSENVVDKQVAKNCNRPASPLTGIETVFQTLQAAVSLDDPRLRHEARSPGLLLLS